MASECGAHVVAIGAAEVTSKVYGETEARLKALFAEVSQWDGALHGDGGGGLSCFLTPPYGISHLGRGPRAQLDLY